MHKCSIHVPVLLWHKALGKDVYVEGVDPMHVEGFSKADQ